MQVMRLATCFSNALLRLLGCLRASLHRRALPLGMPMDMLPSADRVGYREELCAGVTDGHQVVAQDAPASMMQAYGSTADLEGPWVDPQDLSISRRHTSHEGPEVAVSWLGELAPRSCNRRWPPAAQAL
jgi:hypothetical protein